jgi:hypothetical protein
MRAFLCLLAVIFIQTLMFKNASTSFQVRTVAKINWDIVGQNIFNKGCKYDANGKCGGFCTFTMKRCEELVNFDSKVCGCGYCTFNTVTKKCNGQCGILVLDTCVSKVAIPAKDSDCVCSSCNAEIKNVNIGDDENPEYEDVPSCDRKSCNNNPCEPVYISLNSRARVNDTLYCNCKNSFLQY